MLFGLFERRLAEEAKLARGALGAQLTSKVERGAAARDDGGVSVVCIREEAG